MWRRVIEPTAIGHESRVKTNRRFLDQTSYILLNSDASGINRDLFNYSRDRAAASALLRIVEMPPFFRRLSLLSRAANDGDDRRDHYTQHDNEHYAAVTSHSGRYRSRDAQP